MRYHGTVRSLGVLAVLVGCYSPHVRGGVPCGEGEACPTGQTCRAGICRGDEGTEVDASLESDGGSDSALIDAASDGPTIDAPPGSCAGNDGICLVACVATDPDCTTTCGDSRCVGNAGELCGNCAADCATTATVCGNAECEPGESPDCFADCGPVPWTWAAEEQQLIALINNARTGGFTCPGGALVTRPAYTIDPTMKAGAREWIWEMSHHDYLGNAGDGCSGRTSAQRKLDGNFTGYTRSRGYVGVQAAFNAMMAGTTSCPIVMSATATQMNVAVSFDTTKSYLMVIR